MAMPVRSLPVIANWDCGGCSDCCRTYHVRVTPAEKARIDGQKWDVDAVGADPKTGEFRMNHTADGACVLLGPDNKCRIHAKFGAAAKPLACRVYPFVLVPAGDHWRVGLRFACPSAAANHGRPLTAHASDVSEYAKLLEKDAPAGRSVAPPALGPGQTPAWPVEIRLAGAIDAILAGTGAVEFRVRRAIWFAAECRKAKLDNLAGERLGEFVEIMAAASEGEVPADPTAVPAPSWVGRTPFRQIAAVYARKDNGPDAGVGRNGRFTRLWAAWRFARGTGRIPRLHARILEGATFAAAEAARGPLSPDADALLTRYLRVKVSSLQFCGSPNFGRGFWNGLDSLFLAVPVTLWLARVLATGDGPLPLSAVERAVRIADDNFGYNPLLGADRQAWAVKTLSERGEIAKLVAWYGR